MGLEPQFCADSKQFDVRRCVVVEGSLSLPLVLPLSNGVSGR